MAWLLSFMRGVVCCAAIMLIAAGAMWAQDAAPAPAASSPAFGGPQDWSNRHVIYTRNGSPDDMWKLRDDPRFLSSALLRYMKEQNARGSGQTSSNGLNSDSATANSSGDMPGELQRFGPKRPEPIDPTRPSKNKHSKVDWAVSLGPTAGLAVGETPAIYTANYSSPSCANDFAIYTINATPSSTQANLVGLNNLYSAGDGTGFCATTGPTFMFAYEIGTGPAPLSPVLSLDGTRIAWIENRGARAYLHVTIWSAVAGKGGSATAATIPSGTFSNGVCTGGSACDFALNYTASTYTGCTTAYTAINSHSDLYVDYSSDSAYVSANNGLLYHIKNIFSTTVNPSVDFCIPVNATFETAPNAAMSGPVYDPQLNEVFISDSENIYNFKVNASSFSLITDIRFGAGYSNPVGPGPFVDVLNNFVYLFSSNDKNGNASVTQVSTSLGSATAFTANLGAASGNANPYLFYGAFDNNYFTNGPAYGTHPASTLYSCGTTTGHTGRQSLFALSFNSTTGVMNTTPAMSNNTNVNPSAANGVCSPLTEFYDGTNDRLFVGMGQPGATTGSNAVTMWNINTQLTSASTAATASATNYLGGTSGIAADNNDNGAAQAESVYFSTEDAGSTSTLVAQNGFNITGIYTDGTKFTCTNGGFDNDGNAYSASQIGSTITWNGTTFSLGSANVPDAWTSGATITLPQGNYNTLTILAASVNTTNVGLAGTFTVNYTTTPSTTLTQSVSDWFTPLGFTGESLAKATTYRDTCGGGKDSSGDFDVYGYSFAINPNQITNTLVLPNTRNIVVLAAALSNNCGGADYCAVKLTQGALK